MDFFDNLISQKVNIMKRDKKEQEIQEKQELEKKRKVQFASILDLKHENSHEGEKATPSPVKRKNNFEHNLADKPQYVERNLKEMVEFTEKDFHGMIGYTLG